MINVRRFAAFLVVPIFLVASFTLFANGAKESASGTSTGSQKSATPITIRISTTSVASDWHTKALQVFKDYIDKNSPAGSFDVQIYAGSSLIPASAEFAAVQRNSIQMVYVSAQDLVQHGMTDLLPLTAGYVVKSPAELTAIWKSSLGEKWAAQIGQKFQLHVLGELYLGTRELDLRTTKHINTPADLAGLKLRMPPSQAWVFLGKALGATPTPVAFSELYLALQTGTVDGQDNPLPTDKAAKFYEVTKQIVMTNHLVDGLLMVVNDQTWNSMTPEQQKVVQAAADQAIAYNNSNRIKEEQGLVEFFRSKGLQVYSPDVAAFRKHVLDAYLNDPISKQWPPNIIQELDAIPVPAEGN
ncbi:MAG TPA: TRAP transporter substrate-binding protein DctP [Spirochaetia bacterium]|nr:TRAP transporter substrate-binding protein DctP [Spirochaetia bacterium]